MSDTSVFGRLHAVPAAERPDLLAPPVLAAIGLIPDALVAEIDPAYADTEQLCAQYGVPMDASANAVIVRGTRAVAVPVLDQAGNPAAAISTIAIRQRVPAGRVPRESSRSVLMLPSCGSGFWCFREPTRARAGPHHG